MYLQDNSFLFRSNILEYVRQKYVSKIFYPRGAFHYCHPIRKTFVDSFAKKATENLILDTACKQHGGGGNLWVTFDSFLVAVHRSEFFMIW